MNATGKSAAAVLICTALAAPWDAGAQSLNPATISASGSTCGAVPCNVALSESTGSGTSTNWSGGAEAISSSVNYLFTSSPPPTNTVLTANNSSISIGPTGNQSTVSWTATTSPSLSSSATFNDNVGQTDNAGAFTYQYEVVTPSGYTGPSSVNVLVSANASVSAQTGAAPGQAAIADAYMQVLGQSSIAITDSVNAEYGVANGGTSNGSTVEGTGVITSANISAGGSLVQGGFKEQGTSLLVAINTPYTVTLRENLECASTGGGNCSATIDPTIQGPSGLTVEFSPNLTAVPLPAGAWLLLSAALGLGPLVYRRQAVRAA